MRSRFTIFGLALFFPLFGAVAASSADSQIEQSRQFGSTFRPPEVQVEGGDAPIQPVVIDLDDESFGAQQILKRVEKIQPFNAFADVSAFYTNNVALTRRKTLGDTFLVANFGLSCQRKINDALEAELTLKG